MIAESRYLNADLCSSLKCFFFQIDLIVPEQWVDRFTCKTVVPGSTKTLWSSTKTSIFSGTLAGVAAFADVRTTAKTRDGAPNDKVRVSGVLNILFQNCGQIAIDYWLMDWAAEW